jgi:hypothetical protein
MGTANSVSPLASPENERTTPPCSDASAKGPCPKCGMPMRLGFVEPLDEPGHERRLYECLSCKSSVTFVIKVP